MDNWKQSPLFHPLDLRLAECFAEDDQAQLAIALTHHALRQGHACLDLRKKPVMEHSDAWDAWPWPSLDAWKACLANKDAVGSPTKDDRPMVLDPVGRLYLRRFWRYEQGLIREFKRIGRKLPYLPPNYKNGIKEDPTAGRLSPGQRAALQQAVEQSLLIISGGPGTGKTTTVLSILHVLKKLTSPDRELRVALAAPTGKAAQRIQESMQQGLEGLAMKDRLPEALTLHRLLEYMPVSGRFRRHGEHPLDHDLIIVDEASMLDLALMHQLAVAVADGSRLLLLGDKDQLASVDAGSVLGDLVDGVQSLSSEEQIPQVCVLKEYFRFDANSGIAALCENIRKGDIANAMRCLERHADYKDLSWISRNSEADLDQYLRDQFLPRFLPRLSISDPMQALAALRRSCLLSPMRKGPFGTESLNERIFKLLARHKKSKSGIPGFCGCPVLVKENDYESGLFNGDLGVMLPGEADEWTVVFPHDDEHGYRRMPLEQLPAFDYAFAMTVHKSQGSEFEEASLVLPNKDNALLSRELLYTAVSRARKHATVISSQAILEACIRRKISRDSGLVDAMKDEHPGD